MTPWSLITVLVMLFTAAVIARLLWQLVAVTRAHDAAVARQLVVTAAAARLTGVTDVGRIRELGRQALAELSRRTPGLRVVQLEREGAELIVSLRTGAFERPPAILRTADLGVPEGRLPAGPLRRPGPLPALDAGVGRRCSWLVQAFPAAGPEVLLAVGRPGPPDPALDAAVQAVITQSALALRAAGTAPGASGREQIDQLTGLVGREGFIEALGALVNSSSTGRAAVLFLGLDDFKRVNEVFGQKAGDELLREVGLLLRGLVRADDVAARIGGDEFAVVLRDSNEAVAAQVAERIGMGIAVIDVTSPIRVGASIGIAMARPGMRLDDLLAQAGFAMDDAKAGGRGQVRAFRGGETGGETG
ncbi:GGDEF domain-containing protein [Kineosporia sp. J2-2]|uniref:GGDEF domain-containing protein n=1 Tax=Kineosporia corallincola TaxID=2835133 RepID=A0ABS5TII4_9ACTN|nr:GGDEF domain-containing protein [Kineosporia corallincola]MBT0770886.1 GGDEF domain-containing protein [Kineosporia corallincola]